MGSYNLQIGDRLIRPKGLVKHHGIYVGIRNGVPCVAENQRGMGVQFIPYTQFLSESPGPIKTKRFNGTENERAMVIPRIEALVGSNYDLINFNCEHFAELIQNGKAVSSQVGLFVLGTIAVLGYFALRESRR